MPELERSLRTLQVEWPATPDVASRLELAPRRSRRWIAVAAVAVALAIGAAFAVPQSRSAILRFFHLGGVSVERVETLPPAEQRPLAAALGQVVDDARLALACRYLLELSEAETAAALGVRKGTVKSRVSRALDRLRESYA